MSIFEFEEQNWRKKSIHCQRKNSNRLFVPRAVLQAITYAAMAFFMA